MATPNYYGFDPNSTIGRAIKANPKMAQQIAEYGRSRLGGKSNGDVQPNKAATDRLPAIERQPGTSQPFNPPQRQQLHGGTTNVNDLINIPSKVSGSVAYNPPAAPTTKTTNAPAPAGNGVMGAILQRLAQLQGIIGNENPSNEAKAAVAGYGAPIAAERQLIGQTQTQDKSNLSQIQNWFSQLLGQNKASDTADSTALQSVLGDNSFNGVLDSLGGNEDAKAQLAKALAYEKGGLASIGTAEGNYNRNMDTALALTGRDAATGQANKQDTAMQTMKDQLVNLLTTKAGAFASARSSASQQRIANLGDLLKEYETAAVLPGQIDYNNARTLKALTPKPTSLVSVNPDTLTKTAAQLLYGNGATIGNTIPKGKTPSDLYQSIRSALINAKLMPGTPQYQQAGKTVLSQFIDPMTSKPYVPRSMDFNGSGNGVGY